MSNPTSAAVAGHRGPREQPVNAPRRVADELDKLTDCGWVVWHQRQIPQALEVIEHVLIGPPGLVLISSLVNRSGSRRLGRENLEIQQTRARVEEQRAKAHFAVDQCTPLVAPRFARWNVLLWAAVVVDGPAVETHHSPQVIRLPHAIEFFRGIKARLLPMQIGELGLGLVDLFPEASRGAAATSTAIGMAAGAGQPAKGWGDWSGLGGTSLTTVGERGGNRSGLGGTGLTTVGETAGGTGQVWGEPA